LIIAFLSFSFLLFSSFFPAGSALSFLLRFLVSFGFSVRILSDSFYLAGVSAHFLFFFFLLLFIMEVTFTSFYYLFLLKLNYHCSSFKKMSKMRKQMRMPSLKTIIQRGRLVHHKKSL